MGETKAETGGSGSSGRGGRGDRGGGGEWGRPDLGPSPGRDDTTPETDPPILIGQDSGGNTVLTLPKSGGSGGRERRDCYRGSSSLARGTTSFGRDPRVFGFYVRLHLTASASRGTGGGRRRAGRRRRFESYVDEGLRGLRRISGIDDLFPCHCRSGEGLKGT